MAPLNSSIQTMQFLRIYANPSTPTMTTAGYVGAGICLFGVLCALISVGQIANDIASLQDEFSVGLEEFRLIAEDTWDRLLILQSPTGHSVNAVPSIFRAKRYVYPGQCNCQENNQGCPAGPPGPPGPPGTRGDEGLAGVDGKPGVNGNSLSVMYDTPGGCIRCPPGPPGEQGPTGSEGEQGFPGSPGKVGPPGADGTPGPVGVPGDDGEPGKPGFDGATGPDGMPGTTSFPGAPGQPGEPGWTGEPGLPGKAGEPGLDGNPGTPGTPGLPGNPGHDAFPGMPGPAGLPGKVGEDANYCNCPARQDKGADAPLLSPPRPTAGGYRNRRL